jgi:hypothetical protein
MRAAQAAPFATLCDVMFDHVPARGSAPAAELFDATRRDYGTVGERRLWRALRRLIDTQRVQRIGVLYLGCTYRRSAT